MKNKQNIRELLGLSQENLALLLQVSRSQLAMFEIGKRSLPVHAMEKLTIMLEYLQKEGTTIKVKKGISYEEQNFIKKLLFKNKHQQLLVERKIIAIEKKQNVYITSKKLIAHLLKNESKIEKNELTVLKAIDIKLKNQDIENYAALLLQLKLKKEVLAYEEKLLRKKI